jgi:ATP-dependent DNA helicase HFM1/MER3
MQSVCFDALISGSTNVCVSAPTGSGKTLLFELGIVRLLMAPPPLGKTVYLAPLRALAAERAADWAAKFGARGGFRGLSVALMVGGEGEGDGPGGGGGEDGAPAAAAPSPARWQSTLRGADIIVTTPEKWDSVTRGWQDHAALIGQVALLCIDEVHLVGEDRGGTLEALVSRMRTMGAAPDAVARGWPAAALRTIAASATLPNLRDVAAWLGVPPQGVFAFGDAFRPTPLTTYVLGFEAAGTNPFLFEKLLDGEVAGVVARFAGGRPALVFCASRKGAQNTAEELARAGAGAGAGGGGSGGGCGDFCARAAARAADGALAACLRRGTAFHSAALGAGDRALVEGLFLSGALPVLACTTTLALGVNLPAYLVVVKGTSAWRGSGEGYVEHPRATVLQMLGRAGRPQFDERGVAVVLTCAARAGAYRTLAAGAEPVESALGASLVEHLASEAALGTFTSPAGALAWLKGTFYFQRCTTPGGHQQRYGLPPHTPPAPAAEAVTRTLAGHLLALHRAGCIGVERARGGSGHGGTWAPWSPPDAGALLPCAGAPALRFHARGPCRVLSRHFLRLPTLALFSEVPPGADVPAAVAVLARAAEFQRAVVVRREDKRPLRAVKETLGRVRAGRGAGGGVATVADKVRGARARGGGGRRARRARGCA